MAVAIDRPPLHLPLPRIAGNPTGAVRGVPPSPGDDLESGSGDLNSRPHGPEPCALAWLRYSPNCGMIIAANGEMAKSEVTMSLQIGIVGLPNAGKSTLFNALTLAGAAVAPYPFTTVDPNIGIAFVPDPRLGQLADLVHPEKVVPASVEFVDIAGLVKGASQGAGLGNQFLGHIRNVDAVVLVLRAFEDPDIPP